MTERNWMWIAAIAAIAGAAYSDNAWSIVVAIIIVWKLIYEE